MTINERLAYAMGRYDQSTQTYNSDFDTIYWSGMVNALTPLAESFELDKDFIEAPED